MEILRPTGPRLAFDLFCAFCGCVLAAAGVLARALGWLGQDEEQGEAHDEEEGHCYIDEGEGESELVEHYPHHVTARHRPEQGRVQVSIHEAVVSGGVEPEDGEEDSLSPKRTLLASLAAILSSILRTRKVGVPFKNIPTRNPRDFY